MGLAVFLFPQAFHHLSLSWERADDLPQYLPMHVHLFWFLQQLADPHHCLSLDSLSQSPWFTSWTIFCSYFLIHIFETQKFEADCVGVYGFLRGIFLNRPTCELHTFVTSSHLNVTPLLLPFRHEAPACSEGY